MYKILYSRQAVKDAKKIKASNLHKKCQYLIQIIESNPFEQPPPYEKLVGDLAGFYSRRINIQHRLVYTVEDDRKIVKILKMWTHYE